MCGKLSPPTLLSHTNAHQSQIAVYWVGLRGLLVLSPTARSWMKRLGRFFKVTEEMKMLNEVPVNPYRKKLFFFIIQLYL